MIAAAAENEPVRLWLGRGTEPRTLTADANANPRSVSFSPNGKLLATAGGDGVIRIYDTATASLAGSYVAANIKDQSVTSVRFSRDGKALVSAGNGGMVRVFRIEEKRS